MELNGNNGICPACYQSIPEERRADPVIVCAHCGWTNSEKEKSLEKQSQRKMTGLVMLGSALLVGTFIHLVNWNEYALEIAPLKIKQWTQSAERQDYLRIAEICREEGKPACVEQSYQEIVDRNPNDLEALSLLGKVQANRDRMQEAVSTLTRYFQQGGIDLETSYYYAKALGATGNVDEASQYYQMILNARPDVLQVTVAQNYVRLLIENDRPKEAKQLIKEIRSKGSNTKYFMQTELRHLEEQDKGPSPN